MTMALGSSSQYSTTFSAQRKKQITRVLILAALLIVAATTLLPPERSRLQCTGKMSTKYGFRPASLNIEMERPGWAIREWRDDKGFLQVEVPKEALLHYKIVSDDGDLLQVALSEDQSAHGNYSVSTFQLALRTPQGLFLGSCNPVN